jgi:hypothetical protein
MPLRSSGVGLVEEAQAFARREGSSKEFVTTLLTRRASGRTVFTMMVADGSDRAVALARRDVRKRRDVVEYAVVTRMNVGTNQKVMIIEGASRGDTHAVRFAESVSPEPRREDLAAVPSAFVPIDPWALDWGPVTPDLMSQDSTVAAHVVNHELSGANVGRTLRFLRARIRFHARHLPPGCAQEVVVDTRGQVAEPETLQRIVAGLAPTGAAVRFL